MSQLHGKREEHRKMHDPLNELREKYEEMARVVASSSSIGNILHGSFAARQFRVPQIDM